MKEQKKKQENGEAGRGVAMFLFNEEGSRNEEGRKIGKCERRSEEGTHNREGKEMENEGKEAEKGRELRKGKGKESEQRGKEIE